MKMTEEHQENLEQHGKKALQGQLVWEYLANFKHFSATLSEL